MIYEEQLPPAIWTSNFRKHILCGGAGSVGALPARRLASRERKEGRGDGDPGLGPEQRGSGGIRHFRFLPLADPFGHDSTLAGFPHSSVGKECTCNAGDMGSIPGSGRSPGEGNSNPLQSSCLDRGAWQATVPGLARVGHDLVTKPPRHYPCGALVLPTLKMGRWLHLLLC